MSATWTLYRESMGDALRRRITPVIVAVCLFSIMMLDGCTACATGGATVNGEPTSFVDMAGGAGLVTLVTLGLWIMVLAAVLAADHLQQTLDDGSAHLCLSRPISRTRYALSRLAGALTLAWAAGLVLFATTAGLLAYRGGLPLEPALWAALACALGTVTVGSLSMAASMLLPRLGAILLSLVCIGGIAMANGVESFRQSGEGLLGWVHRVGPPLASSIAKALDVWVPGYALPGNGVEMTIRLALWAAIGVMALRVAFDRAEV